MHHGSASGKGGVGVQVGAHVLHRQNVQVKVVAPVLVELGKAAKVRLVLAMPGLLSRNLNDITQSSETL